MKFAKPMDGAPAFMMRRWEAQQALEANGPREPDETPVLDDETEQTQKRPVARLILALVTAIVCIGGSLWVGSEHLTSDISAANLEPEFSRERSRASVAVVDLAAARERENAAQKKQMELKQALDETEKRALALERENVAQKQTADAKQMELKQALEESEKTAQRARTRTCCTASKQPMPGRWN